MYRNFTKKFIFRQKFTNVCQRAGFASTSNDENGWNLFQTFNYYVELQTRVYRWRLMTQASVNHREQILLHTKGVFLYSYLYKPSERLHQVEVDELLHEVRAYTSERVFWLAHCRGNTYTYEVIHIHTT